MIRKARITVLRCMSNPDLAATYRKPTINKRFPVPCSVFDEGQEFLLSTWDSPPAGFCPWAWADIHKEIMLVMSGGSHIGLKDPGTAIACCTDAFKPVVFKIEDAGENQPFD